MSLDEQRQKYKGKNMNIETITCRYCGLTCKNKLSRAKHEHFCRKNPNYERNMETHRNTTLRASFSEEVSERRRKSCEKSRLEMLKNNPDEEYRDFELTCKKCGNKFIRRLKIRHFKTNYRIPQFCCTEHAHSRVHTEESRKKISCAVKQEHLHTCPKCGRQFMHTGTAVNQTFCDECHLEKNGYSRKVHNANKSLHEPKSPFRRNIRGREIKLRNDLPLHSSNCPECGKVIWSKTSDIVYCYDCCEKLKMYRHQLYDKFGHRVISETTREKLKNVIRCRIKNGTHNGWASRKIKSYPEIFWENVLKNNGIPFAREKPEHGYFLDFSIEKDGKIIDLEIDGKQHEYPDRAIHDKKRDRKLRELGYLVYRIRWNSINNNVGNKRMLFKIRQFMWWYKHQ